MKALKEALSRSPAEVDAALRGARGGADLAAVLAEAGPRLLPDHAPAVWEAWGAAVEGCGGGTELRGALEALLPALDEHHAAVASAQSAAGPHLACLAALERAAKACAAAAAGGDAAAPLALDRAFRVWVRVQGEALAKVGAGEGATAMQASMLAAMEAVLPVAAAVPPADPRSAGLARRLFSLCRACWSPGAADFKLLNFAWRHLARLLEALGRAGTLPAADAAAALEYLDGAASALVAEAAAAGAAAGEAAAAGRKLKIARFFAVLVRTVGRAFPAAFSARAAAVAALHARLGALPGALRAAGEPAARYLDAAWSEHAAAADGARLRAAVDALRAAGLPLQACAALAAGASKAGAAPPDAADAAAACAGAVLEALQQPHGGDGRVLAAALRALEELAAARPAELEPRLWRCLSSPHPLEWVAARRALARALGAMPAAAQAAAVSRALALLAALPAGGRAAERLAHALADAGPALGEDALGAARAWVQGECLPRAGSSPAWLARAALAACLPAAGAAARRRCVAAASALLQRPPAGAAPAEALAPALRAVALLLDAHRAQACPAQDLAAVEGALGPAVAAALAGRAVPSSAAALAAAVDVLRAALPSCPAPALAASLRRLGTLADAAGRGGAAAALRGPLRELLQALGALPDGDGAVWAAAAPLFVWLLGDGGLGDRDTAAGALAANAFLRFSTATPCPGVASFVCPPAGAPALRHAFAAAGGGGGALFDRVEAADAPTAEVARAALEHARGRKRKAAARGLGEGERRVRAAVERVRGGLEELRSAAGAAADRAWLAAQLSDMEGLVACVRGSLK